MRIILTILLTLLITTTSHAIFKWRDADGKLHFSDTPPLSTKTIEKFNVVQNQAAETKTEWIQKKEAHAKTEERIARVDEKAKQWREENKEFSEQECNAALKSEQIILELIRLDPARKSLFATDLNILSGQRRIACP